MGLDIAYWAGTRVKESTDGEWMKTVKYDHAFKLRTPRQMDSGVGVTVWNDCTQLKQYSFPAVLTRLLTIQCRIDMNSVDVVVIKSECQLRCDAFVGNTTLSGGTIVFKDLAEKRWAICFYQRDVQRDAREQKLCLGLKCVAAVRQLTDNFNFGPLVPNNKSNRCFFNH